MAKRVIRLEHEENQAEMETRPAPRRKPRSRRKFWGFLLLLLVATVAFLPQILSYTPAGDWALNRFLPRQYGTVTTARRNLAWWSPVSVGGIRLLDPQGELLAEVGQLTTRETLWEIVTTGQLTRLDVDQAAGRLVWRPDGSNWETYVFALLESMPASDPNATMADMQIHVQNSQALLESLTDDQRWMAMDVSAVIDVTRNGNDIRIQTECSLLDAKQNLPAGRCESLLVVADAASLKTICQELQIQCGGAGFEAGMNEGGVVFTAKMEEVAASLGRSVARRYMPGLHLNGLASGKVAGVANYRGDYVFLQTPKIIAERLEYGDTAWMSNDQIRQRRVDVTGAFEMNAGGLVFQETKLRADVGQVDLNGVLDYQSLAQIWESRRLPQQALDSSGQVDLAQLANQLPETLQLREGLTLSGGNLDWKLFNRKEGDGSQRLFVDVTAKNLAGQLSGESMAWKEPIKLSTSLRDYGKPLFVENLNLQSNFMTANASPTPDGGGKVQFQCDFDRMKMALEQFFQLPPMTMQGRGNGQMAWSLGKSETGQSTMQSAVTLDLQNANLILPGYFELRDPDIALRASSELQLGQQDQSRSLWETMTQSADLVVSKGTVNLQTGAAAIALRQGQPAAAPLPGGDAPLGLSATLNQPVSLARLMKSLNRLMGDGVGQPVSQQPVLQADLQVSGPLENWLSLVRPLLVGTDLALTGNSQSRAQLILMDGYASLGGLHVKASQFGFRGYGTILQEPQIQIDGALSYHFDSGLLHIGDLLLGSQTAVLRATQTKVRMVDNRLSLQGDLGYRLNVQRFYQTISLMHVASEPGDTTLGMGSGLNPQQLHTLKLLNRPANAPEFENIQLVSYEPTAEPHLPAEAVTGDLQFGGEWVGTAHFEQNKSAETLVRLESNLNEGWIGGIQPNGELRAYVKEPVIVIKGEGKLSADANQLDFQEVTVQSHRMSAIAAGGLQQLMTTPTINMAARLNANLLQWVEPFAGESLGDLKIDGLSDHQLRIAGPLQLTTLTGSWTTQWKSIGWMGLTGGAADVVLDLSEGILKMRPLRFVTGGGQVNLAPELNLRGDPVWVRLPKGVVFDQVQLTPQLCRNWLKYAAPLLAEVTSVQGTFSLDSDGIEVPLSNWTSMVAKARVTINGARLGPGPLGTQIGQVISAVKTVSDGGSLDANTLGGLGLGGLSGLAASGNGQRSDAIGQLASGVLGSLGNGQKPNLGQLVAGQDVPTTATAESEKVWLDIPKQTVAVNLANGGVEHEQLKMNIKGFELISNGRVGLDQSLAVNTQLNIPQEVLQKNPAVGEAFGPSVLLPISGTLTRPSLQSSQLRTALNTAVNRSVQKAVGDQLEKKLGVPGLGELGTGSGNPLDGLLQQGQQKLGEKLGLPANLPPGLPGIVPQGALNPNLPAPNNSQPPATNAPTGQPGGSPTPPAAGSNSLDSLFQQQLNKGLNKLLK